MILNWFLVDLKLNAKRGASCALDILDSLLVGIRPELDSTVILFCLCVVDEDRDFDAWKVFDDSNDELFSW